MVFRRQRRRRDRGDIRTDPSPGPDPIGDWIPVDRDIRLWYRTVGEGGGTPLVVPCVGNSDDLVRLASPGRQVIYYDVRNRGRSDPVPDLARISFDSDVTDLAMVCDTLGLDRVAILGSGYHAGVAVRFALAEQDRVERLVLVSPIPPRSGILPEAGPEPSEDLRDRLAHLELDGIPESDPKRWCEEWRRAYVPLRMGVTVAFEQLASPCDMPNENPRSVARTMVCIFTGLASYDWIPQLRALTVPTLVVRGTVDAYPAAGAEEWSAALPDAVLMVLRGVGQYPWVEAPERFFHHVDRFLTGDPLA